MSYCLWMMTREERDAELLSSAFETLGPVRRRRFVLLEQNHSCNRCGLREWFGLPLTLEYEHKDGNRFNDSRDNVECICPNCHSQTPTWRGRNNASDKVAEAEFVAALRSTMNTGQALVKLGLAGGKNYKRANRLRVKYGL